MDNVATQNIGLHALVRDKNGKPKFDNINNIPAGFWDLLTKSEQADIIKQRGK